MVCVNACERTFVLDEVSMKNICDAPPHASLAEVGGEHTVDISSFHACVMTLCYENLPDFPLSTDIRAIHFSPLTGHRYLSPSSSPSN